MRHSLFAMVIIVGSTGCASQSNHRWGPQNTVVVVDKNTGERETDVCEPQRPTGSNISRVMCRTEDEADDEADTAQLWVKSPRSDATREDGSHVSNDPFKRPHH